MNISREEGHVYYLYAYCSIPILIGVITSIIFSIGAIVLDEPTYWCYLILSVGLIIMGYMRLKKPYIVYSKNAIHVNGIFGIPFIKYEIQNKSQLKFSRNRLYYQGEKLKFNAWFVNRHQYKAMLNYFINDPDFANQLHD